MAEYTISEEQKEIIYKMRTGEIDLNNSSNFFSILIKAVMVKLNQTLKIRGRGIPHILQHTGDIIKYLEEKNQDFSIEPYQISNEDYIYSEIPRCNITPGDISLMPDQMTNPYTRGNFVWQYGESRLYTFSAEFRRMPIKMAFSLEYTLDSYTDSLALIQQIISKLSYIQTFNIIYLGQSVGASYSMPSSYTEEHAAEITGSINEQLKHVISFSIEVETYFPIYNEKTVIGECNIRTLKSNILDAKQNTGLDSRVII